MLKALRTSTSHAMIRRRSKVFLFILVVALIAAISFLIIVYHPQSMPRQPSKVAQKTTKQPATTPPAHTPQGLTLPANFTLQDKIGQLLFVGVTKTAIALDLEKKYQIGGFLIETNADLFSKAATEQVKQNGELAPLFAIDQEGGYVSRLPNAAFKHYTASYLGTLPDNQVQTIGNTMGAAMASLGAYIDFAPVVDLNNPNNMAIGYWQRSFSSSPTIVAQKAAAFADGLRSSGVVPTFKHYPGLGNATGPTGGDTDTGPATSPPLQALEQSDLVPYQSLLPHASVSTVMVGNQTVPGLTDGLPASLSSATYALLRNTYHFNQVILTDEITGAKSITAVEPSPSAAVIAAIKAGADMPLVDVSSEQEVADIINDTTQAVLTHEITTDQIDASLGRILELKTWIAKNS